MQESDDELKAKLNIAEVVYPEDTELHMTEIPRYLILKVVLDSGAGAHVVNKSSCPGYTVRESEMSKAGAAFLGADGGRIKNYGEVLLNIMTKDARGNERPVTSKFEVADVTRALWSVGVICDSGLKVDFDADKASVRDPSGREVCIFYRVNGLYVADVKVENPLHEDFQRRGR